MSENTTTAETNTEAKASGDAETNTIFAFKMGMTSYVTDSGEVTAATLLRVDPWFISQLKTKEKDGYTAVQVACSAKRASRASKSETKHLKAAGFENGAHFVREIRQEKIDGLSVGQKISMGTVKAGDTLKLTSRSKGKGFAGVVKRWGNAGGPATHGSGFHRHPGSVGNRTWPGRVMPGKHFPGHLGDENVTLPRVKVMDVIESENVIVVQGAVPGGPETLVKLTKV